MSELIGSAASNRRRHFNKERAKSQLQPRRPARRRRRRRRPRRGSHFFLRVRVRPPRPAATGCGTRRIGIRSISPPTRPGVLNKHLVKAIGSTAAACAILPAARRRPRARREPAQLASHPSLRVEREGGGRLHSDCAIRFVLRNARQSFAAVICVLYYWARERLILEPGRHLRKLGRLGWEAVEAANAVLRGDSSEIQGGQDILSFPQLTAIVMKVHDFCHGFFASPFRRV
jgi:hypothetical protein